MSTSRLIAAALVIAAGAARADARPAPTVLAWEAEYRPADGEVRVDDWPGKPPAGTYVLIGTRGPVGTLAIDGAPSLYDDCRYQISGHLVGAPAWTSTAQDVEHYVVIGPIAAAALQAAPGGSPRLMMLGGATMGHAADEVEDTLGVAAPPGGVSFAIDLDGDGTADLVAQENGDHGRFVHGVATGWLESRVWRRAGKRWTSIARCRWTSIDTIR